NGKLEPAWRPRIDAVGAELAMRPQAERRDPYVDDGRHQQRDHGRGDDVELEYAEDAPGDHEAGRPGQGEPAPAGGHQRPVGTGMLASTSSRASAGLMPASCASGV